jgi:PAS domain S-box-containing protein
MADKQESMVRSKSKSLSGQMLLLFLVTILIPVASMGLFFYQYMSNSLKKEIMLYSDFNMKEKSEYFELLTNNVAHIARAMLEHEDMPSAFRELQTTSDLDDVTSIKEIDNLRQTYAELSRQQGIRKLQLLMLDGKGLELYNQYIKPCQLSVIFMRQLSQQEIKDPKRVSWFWNSNDATQNNESLIAWLPLFNETKTNKIGYLLVFLDMSFLHSRLQGEQQYEQYFAVIDENLLILYHTEEQRIGTFLKPEHSSKINHRGTYLIYDFNHQLSIVSQSIIKSSNWSFLSFIPYQYVQKRTSGVLSTTFSLVFLLLVLAVIFGSYLTNYYLTPLNKITQHFKSYQQGNTYPEINLKEKGNNEITELTKWYKLFFINLKEKELIDKKLSQKQKEYHQLVNSVREVLFRMNQQGFLVFLNQAWEEITSYSINEALDTSILSYIHPDDQIKFQSAFDSLKNEKTELKIVVRFIKPKQKHGWMEIIARMDEDQEDSTEALVSGIMIDITERKELDVLKDNFINALCHEIKTPFTTFKQGIQILSDGERYQISREEKKYIFETLNNNISRLQRLLDNLFVYKGIEEGEESYILQADNLNQLVASVVEEMRPQAKAKALSLEFIEDPKLKELEFDKGKVERAFKNLLDNAIKFTQQGGIKVSTKLQQDKALVIIQDTGIGILEEDFSKLFHQFSQLSCGLNRTTGGTGLGLVIAKRIMEQHQGTIKLQSEFQKGSCFTMEFPYKV